MFTGSIHEVGTVMAVDEACIAVCLNGATETSHA